MKRLTFAGLSRTDRNNVRAWYRTLRHIGHTPAQAREVIGDELGW